MAEACARSWAEPEATFFLVGRTAEKLEQVADDLTARGANTHTYVLDLNHFDLHTVMLDVCFEKLGQVDVVLIAHGTLPDQQACEQDPQLAVKEFTNNGLSVIALLTDLGIGILNSLLGIIQNLWF